MCPYDTISQRLNIAIRNPLKFCLPQLDILLYKIPFNILIIFCLWVKGGKMTWLYIIKQCLVQCYTNIETFYKFVSFEPLQASPTNLSSDGLCAKCLYWGYYPHYVTYSRANSCQLRQLALMWRIFFY